MFTLSFLPNGLLTAERNGNPAIAPSPVCTLVNGGRMIAPSSCIVSADGKRLSLTFESSIVEIDADTSVGDRTRLTVVSVPAGTEVLQFGPYLVPDCRACGELLGAAWQVDGGAVCIQSLSPKTVGGGCSVTKNETAFIAPKIDFAAWPTDTISQKNMRFAKMTRVGNVTLGCNVRDMTRGNPGPVGDIVEPVLGPDGEIAGASVVLCGADSADELLDTIGKIEVTYGLPHPTIDGVWAKQSPRADEIYFVFDGSGDNERRIELAQRAGVRCVYFGDPFKSWGHFEINKNVFPDGFDGFRAFVDNAAAHGVDTGFHTLSNFIHTHDPYVTPVPHAELKAWRRTTLAQAIGADDTTINVTNDCDFASSTTLNTLRVGDELMRYTGFDAATGTVTGVTRGAFGTQAVPHGAGDALLRLSDHGYGTLFPTIHLQDEMASRIGALIRDAGIRRISFDGLEGCEATGLGEYACSEYVRKVFEVCGGNLICDASTSSHYRWHAHSYFNWGEPWWEDNHLGGSFNYRADNCAYFRRNLYPAMLGWYAIWAADPQNKSFGNRMEATSTEMLETMLSRTVGFDAGCCFWISEGNALLEQHMDTINRWVRFKADRVANEADKALMRQEGTCWHLEETETTWRLIRQHEYNMQLVTHESVVGMESGTTGYDFTAKETDGCLEHRTIYYMDRSSTLDDYEPQSEPFHCRIRVGLPYQIGTLANLTFAAAWAASPVLSFTMEAQPGDYLEYRGGHVLYRYDANYKLLATYTGVGDEITVNNNALTYITVRYLTPKDAKLDVTTQSWQTAYVTEYPKKS